MDDISKELSISKKTVYNYFSSKKELIRRAIEKLVKQSIENLKKEYMNTDNNVQKLEVILTSCAKNIKEDEVILELKRYYPEIYKEHFSSEYNYREKLFIETIEKIYANNDSARQININILLNMLKGFVDKLDLEFLIKNDLTLEDLFQDLKNLILFGVLGEENK